MRAMVSPLATLLFTWAAIYAYVGVYLGTLYARRPSHDEYLAFGLLSLGLTVRSVGSGLAADAYTVAEANFAYQVELVGGFSVAALFVRFASLLVRRPAARIVLGAYWTCGVGIVADVAGLVVATEARVPTWGIELLPGRVEVGLTGFGMVALTTAIGFTVWGVWTIARGSRSSPDLRFLAWAASVAFVAGVADLLVPVFEARSLFLLDHAALVPVLAVSFLLQRRYLTAADELGERTEELRESSSELRLVQEELVRKEQLAAVGMLSAVIAHEVRNPLAIIKNAVSSLRRPTLRDSDRGVLLGILDEEVDRLDRLVRNLLAYARPVEPRGEPVDLLAIALEAVEAARARHEDPESVAVEAVGGSISPIHADPVLLQQALGNVAENAMQAMPGGGTLTIRASEDPALPGWVRIKMQDDGAGMDPMVRSKALDPFFTTRPSGTGLGLAIVERVVRNHGGSLAIESEPGRGCTVQIDLPRERTSAAPEPPEAPS